MFRAKTWLSVSVRTGRHRRVPVLPLPDWLRPSFKHKAKRVDPDVRITHVGVIDVHA